MTLLVDMVRDMRSEIGMLSSEVKDLRSEVKVGFLEARANLAEFRLTTTQNFVEVHSRLDTLFGALADFRAEYNEHTHPDQS